MERNPITLNEVDVRHDRQWRLDRDGVDEVPVLFYHPDRPWGQFSNFSPHEVTLPDRFGRGNYRYLTGEHAFQARKMATQKQHDDVATQGEPGLAKWAGGPRGVGKMRDGWGNSYGDLCFYVMLEVVTAKAIQHRDVMDQLEATHGRWIYEDSPTDDIWGWRFENDHRGKNLLGICWMTARDLLVVEG